MKKLVIIIGIVAMFSTLTPLQVDARSKPRTANRTTEQADAQRAEQLTRRLEEIKGMDKSTLTSSEKRQLRKEVHAIKKEMQAMSGGVYISIGALLIIVLLILLL